MNLQSKTLKLSIGFGLIMAAGLALPLSNTLSPREILKVRFEDPEWSEFSRVFQNKCSDCHTPGSNHMPFYVNLPVARDIISSDIKKAQAALSITADELTGKSRPAAVKIAKIRGAMLDGSMPPLRYKAMHWDAGITPAEREGIVAWVDKRKEEFEIKPIPHKDPFGMDPIRTAIGQKLFFDKRLSADESLNCASCHALEKGGTDNQLTSTGIHGHIGPINSPSVFNSGYSMAQFWDGRAETLQEQAAGPVANPGEMGATWDQVVARIKQDKDYVKAFKPFYGDDISKRSITDAIAVYELTLLTPNSRFDKYLEGDKNALSANEIRGYELFQKHNCATCHTGVSMGGQSFEKMGIVKDYFAMRKKRILKFAEETSADKGRFNVTHDEMDMHKFKVPNLRNVALTAPYFHDGSVKDLREAVKIMAECQTESPLSDEEADSIVDFLKSTTGEYKGVALDKLNSKSR